MAKSIPWTKEEEDFLRVNSKMYTNLALAERLYYIAGNVRTPAAISVRASNIHDPKKIVADNISETTKNNFKHPLKGTDGMTMCGFKNESAPYDRSLMKDSVNSPDHYNEHPSGVECIQITEHMNFNLGNAVKYIWRCGLKKSPKEDIEKAIWYLKRELARRSSHEE